MFRSILLIAACFVMGATSLRAQENDWAIPHAPFKVFGNTFYVGTQGITVLLVTSPQGHILIDGGPDEVAVQVAANIAKLGFNIRDVKIILNTHAHFDHSGALAELQRLSGAVVKASPESAPVLASGKAALTDPQVGMHADMRPVANVAVIADGETVKVGATEIKPLFTPGHTSGGTSWAWASCEGTRCLNVVYADSLTAVSKDGFRFSDSKAYPNAVADFGKSFASLASTPCDILITAHPGVSKLWERLEKRDAGNADALVDATACRRLVDNARINLDKRLAWEKTQ